MLSIPDLATLTRLLTKTNTTSLTNANLLILFNSALERIHGKILTETSGGKWLYGDANYAAFPTYTTNLVNSQAEYDINALFATGTYPSRYEPLVILGVEVLDNSGNWHLLSPITLKQIHDSGIAQSEFHETDGQPVYYEKREHILVLYPAPDNGVTVTLTSGLRIFYLRNSEQIDDVTTSATYPGFPSVYHDFLAYMAAVDYAVANNLPNVGLLLSEVQKRERNLLNFMAHRNPDDKKVITTKQINYR